MSEALHDVVLGGSGVAGELTAIDIVRATLDAESPLDERTQKQPLPI